MDQLKKKLKESDNVELQEMAYNINDAATRIYEEVSMLSTNSIKDLFEVSPDLISLAIAVGNMTERGRAKEISKIYDDLLLAATTESKYIPIPEWALEYE